MRREVRTMYASPFTFGNHVVRLTTGDSCLIAVNHYWSADGWMHRSLSARHHWIRASFARATPREEHVPPFDPWFMPGFRQIAIHSDDRRFSGPAIRRFAPCLFTKKVHSTCCEADPFLFARRWKYEVWKCEDVKAWKTLARTITSRLRSVCPCGI